MTNSILDLRYLDGTNWLVLKEFTDHAIGYDPVTVPILQYNNVQYGFVTNLASIPRPLWSIIGHPAMFGPEAVIHDWLYAEKRRPRKECDDIFRILLLQRGVPSTKAWAMYWGVRAVGWRVWNRREPFDYKRPWTDFEEINNPFAPRALKRAELK